MLTPLLPSIFCLHSIGYAIDSFGRCLSVQYKDESASDSWRFPNAFISLTMNLQDLLKAIEADEKSHITFLQRFVQAPSRNPPGDTRRVAQVIVDYLKCHGIEPEIIALQEHLPNVVSDFECGIASGPRLSMVSPPGWRGLYTLCNALPKFSSPQLEPL